MSGLELAAGIFAAVGFVDVVLKTGREVHSFLGDINDAPKDLAALRDSLQRALELADVSKNVLLDLANKKTSQAPGGVASLLQQCLKGLDLELRKLKSHLARYKGTSRSWVNVKYVIDEHKISKATSRIGSLKADLAAALTLASK